MLPTKIQKPKVLSIHGSDNNDTNSSNVASIEPRNEKSFKIKRPKSVPLKRDKSTFFEYSANPIASSDGRRDRPESSIIYT